MGETLGAPNKTCQVVGFLVQNLSGEVGRTKLAKLVFFGDLVSRQLNGKPISNLAYKWDNFGPYDEGGFCPVLHEMVASGQLREDEYQAKSGPGYRYSAGPEPVHFDLTSGERRILRAVLAKYGALSTEQIKRASYETDPMIEAKGNQANNELLNMDALNFSLSVQFEPFTFEELSEGLDDLEAGRMLEL